MPSVDIYGVARVIREVSVTKIMPHFRRLSAQDITNKGREGPATIADRSAEEAYKAILPELYPGSVVVGEESFKSVESLDHPKVWIVDPLDGTRAFVDGAENFGSIVALVENGVCVAGFIYQIPQERMILCEVSAGIEIDGEPFFPATKDLFDQSHAIGHLSRKFHQAALNSIHDVCAFGVAEIGVACVSTYVDLLEGRADFSLYAEAKPWDHVAGSFMLEQAGFYTRKLDGHKYKPTDFNAVIINAQTEELGARLSEALQRGSIAFQKRDGSFAAFGL